MDPEQLVPVILPFQTFVALPRVVIQLVDNLANVQSDRHGDVTFHIRRKNLIAVHRALRTVGK